MFLENSRNSKHAASEIFRNECWINFKRDFLHFLKVWQLKISICSDSNENWCVPGVLNPFEQNVEFCWYATYLTKINVKKMKNTLFLHITWYQNTIFLMFLFESECSSLMHTFLFSFVRKRNKHHKITQIWISNHRHDWQQCLNTWRLNEKHSYYWLFKLWNAPKDRTVCFFFLVRKFSIARISCDGWKGHHLMLALIGKATARNDAVYFVETVHVKSSQYAHCELLRLNAFRMHHQLFIQMWFNFFRHNRYISAHLKTVCTHLSFAIMCKQTKWHRLKIEMKLNSWRYSTSYTVWSS